jgi:hypothetical protein
MIGKRYFTDDSVGFPTDVGNLQQPPGFLIRAVLRNGLLAVIVDAAIRGLVITFIHEEGP